MHITANLNQDFCCCTCRTLASWVELGQLHVYVLLRVEGALVLDGRLHLCNGICDIYVETTGMLLREDILYGPRNMPGCSLTCTSLCEAFRVWPPARPPFLLRDDYNLPFYVSSLSVHGLESTHGQPPVGTAGYTLASFSLLQS